MAWFAVALWRVSPAVLVVNWPEVYDDAVEAPSAFVAMESVMRRSRMLRVAYAMAWACDGSLIYQAFRVWLVPAVDEQEREEVYWWMDV